MFKKLLILSLSIGLVPQLLVAATFTPTTAAEFQTALTTAASNGEDDTITLPAGSFDIADNGSATFSYTSNEDFSLAIQGQGSADTILLATIADLRILRIETDGDADADIFLSGFTVQQADCIAIGCAGAGIFVDTSNNSVAGAGDITIEDIIGMQNYANDGGPLYASVGSGALSLTNSTFEQNYADNDGGGFYLYSFGGAITVDQVVSNDNEAKSTYAAGYIVCQGECNISNSEFTANSTTLGAGGDSAGLVITGNGVNITVDNVTVSQNETDGFRSGLIITDFSSTEGQITISNSAITENSATDGYGGLYIYSSPSNVIVEANTISNNNSAGYCGAYIYSGGTLIVSGNTISENTSTDEIAGIAVSSAGSLQIYNNVISGNTASFDTGGLFVVTQSIAEVTNNTIVGNIAGDQGGGVFVLVSDDGTEYNFYNNIIRGNTATNDGDDVFFAYNSKSATVNVFNNDIGEFCTETDCGLESSGATIGDNVDVDPLFTDEAANDFSLTESSPLIDAGLDSAPALPSVDILGVARTEGENPDIGAYEFDAEDLSGGGGGGGSSGCSLNIHHNEPVKIVGSIMLLLPLLGLKRKRTSLFKIAD